MTKSLLKFALILMGFGLGLCANANALVFNNPKGTPEIDPGIAVSALTLLAGSLAILRTRRKK